MMKSYFLLPKSTYMIIFLFMKVLCGMIKLNVERIDNMKISTSILDCSNRIEGVCQLNETDTSYIHIDVMDGNFVPRTQFDNIEEIREINQVSEKLLDVHLMVEDPSFYIEKLTNMKIEFVTIHLEIVKNKREIFSKIREKGYKVGLSVKPGTDIRALEPYLEDIDIVLVMSVEPGLGGQKFMDSTVERVNQLKSLIQRSGKDILIEVDGGIQSETIQQLKNVDIAVVGSYIVKSDNYKGQVNSLLQYFRT